MPQEAPSRMLRFMDRSTIHLLHQKGWTNTQIAEFLGHHRDTITKVLRQPVDYQPPPRQRTSAVAVFDQQIEQWLDQKLSTQRMLEIARVDADHPYHGSDAAFYAYVRPKRLARRTLPASVAVRFEGLPGELLQIDWGEVRQFPFTRPDLVGQTRYFFAARLKYSRFMWVRFTTDMREETLLRCLIAGFGAVGGVPWVVTTDNMKTVTLGRDDHNEPIWHPAYQKCAVEFAFHPMVCAPAAGNQKGAVENLVKYVKGNFLAGRTFYDDADLEREARAWLHHVNEVRPSSATEQLPSVLLLEEQAKFGPLPAVAHDYGFFDSVMVSRESLVAIATNRYSVPAHLVGQALTARIYPARIELFAGTERIACHTRLLGRNQRSIVPEHYTAVFGLKPRARVVLYRDWLVALDSGVAEYVSTLCRKRYAEHPSQVVALYELAHSLGTDAFVAAVGLACEAGTFGAEYVEAIAAQPLSHPSNAPTDGLHLLLATPAQASVERDLAQYEGYVANRDLSAVPEEGRAA
jgi:transposase